MEITKCVLEGDSPVVLVVWAMKSSLSQCCSNLPYASPTLVLIKIALDQIFVLQTFSMMFDPFNWQHPLRTLQKQKEREKRIKAPLLQKSIFTLLLIYLTISGCCCNDVSFMIIMSTKLSDFESSKKIYHQTQALSQRYVAIVTSCTPLFQAATLRQHAVVRKSVSSYVNHFVTE